MKKKCISVSGRCYRVKMHAKEHLQYIIEKEAFPCRIVFLNPFIYFVFFFVVGGCFSN